MNEKKIIVFGSNGLVGSSVVRKLNNDNKYQVTASTRNDTNLFKLEEVSSIINKINPDVVLIAAAKVGGIHANNTQRVEFLLENIKINMNIFEACIENPDIHIINLGSSCIYPLNSPNPISESEFMNGVLEKTNSPYAMAKLTSIELAEAMGSQYGHKITNLMPTNLYGPNDNFSLEFSHVIPGLMHRMHLAKINSKNSFTAWGTGKPLREFLFVDDLANAISYIIENQIESNLMNIGTSEEVSIEELIKKIQNTVGFKGEVIFDKTKPDGNPRKLLDSNKIFTLGWKPDIYLDEGLKITYDWFLKNQSKIRT
jgi:GDP-L-fucose synthase